MSSDQNLSQQFTWSVLLGDGVGRGDVFLLSLHSIPLLCLFFFFNEIQFNHYATRLKLLPFHKWAGLWIPSENYLFPYTFPSYLKKIMKFSLYIYCTQGLNLKNMPYMITNRMDNYWALESAISFINQFSLQHVFRRWSLSRHLTRKTFHQRFWFNWSEEWGTNFSFQSFQDDFKAHPGLRTTRLNDVKFPTLNYSDDLLFI